MMSDADMIRLQKRIIGAGFFLSIALSFTCFLLGRLSVKVPKTNKDASLQDISQYTLEDEFYTVSIEGHPFKFENAEGVLRAKYGEIALIRLYYLNYTRLRNKK